jgi:hypothetical protein
VVDRFAATDVFCLTMQMLQWIVRVAGVVFVGLVVADDCDDVLGPGMHDGLNGLEGVSRCGRVEAKPRFA